MSSDCNTFERGLVMAEMAAKLRRQRLIDLAVRNTAQGWILSTKLDGERALKAIGSYPISCAQPILAEFSRLQSDPNV